MHDGKHTLQILKEFYALKEKKDLYPPHIYEQKLRSLKAELLSPQNVKELSIKEMIQLKKLIQLE